jgi:DMSO/TMAO reductase YedYZ molybdopterin-dependent catalytic subunit
MTDQSRRGVVSLTCAVATRLPAASSVLVSAAAGLAALAGSYAVAGFTPAFITAPVASVLTDQMPAEVVRFAILVLGDLGEQLTLASALASSWLLLAAGAFLGIVSAQRANVDLLAPVNGAAATGGFAFAVTGAARASFVTGLAAGLVLSIAVGISAYDTRSGVSTSRRRVLGAVATGTGMALAGYVAGSQRQTSVAETGSLEVDAVVQSEAEDLLGRASATAFDVEGIEPLVSEDFYNVDISSVDPDLDADDWELTVTGAVEDEQTYSYDDLTERSAENRFVSLRCVGEGLNGYKMDNALWQGIPIMDLVAPAGPDEGCCVMLHAADGFYEEFPLAALQDGFLAFGMNGDVLPRGHGYPARALIPGHWGEINVKWLTEIEVLEAEAEGYWEERGWHGTGPVNTVAKLHAVNDLDDGRKQVAGHAYAGTRGIQRVEVSTDGGDTWTEARLTDPLPGADVWRQWAHEYDPPADSHEVVVRATDGTGTLQPEDESSAYPSGATGWVSKTVSP